MQVFYRSFKIVPKILPFSILNQKSALEQVVLRGEFRCKNASIIARQLSYREEFNKLSSTAHNTLQTRILEYLRTSNKYSSMTLAAKSSVLHVDIVRKSMKKCLMDIPTLNNSQLAGFIHDLNQRSFNLSMNEKQFVDLLLFLDEECCCRVERMSPREVSTMLDAWMNVWPNRITGLKFYYGFIQQMKKWLSDPNLPAEDFIKLIFYTGLLKKSLKGERIMQLVTNFVEENINLKSLSIEELCIITNAYFKTGTSIISLQMLTTIKDAIIKNLDSLLGDPALFVTLVKALRHAQNYDYELLDLICSKMISNESATHLLGFTAKSHILAWYAGALYGRLDILSFLVESSQKDLKSTSNNFLKTKKRDHLSTHHRSKDLSRFLWSLSCLNYTPEQECLESTIIPELRNRLQRGEYIRKPNEIIDSLLSLWILGFKDETLLAEVVSSETLSVLERENKLYYNSRLALLLTCASIEAPNVLTSEQLSLKDLLPVMGKPNMTRHVISRPQLKKVYGIVSCLSSVLKASSVSCKYIIPHLHIAGIRVKTESQPIYIEVLDSSVCLHKSDKPHGLMQLKLRLMKSLHYQVVIIDNQEIENRSDESSSLYEYIEEKIVAATRW